MIEHGIVGRISRRTAVFVDVLMTQNPSASRKVHGRRATKARANTTIDRDGAMRE